MIRKRLDNKGYTLIEVMMAVVLLGVAAVPLVSLINGQLSAGKEAGERFAATMLAVEKMEEIKRELRNIPKEPPDISEENRVEVAAGVYRTARKFILDSYTVGHNGKGNAYGKTHFRSDQLAKYEVITEWNNYRDSVAVFTYYTGKGF